jgi:hypothetical protein
MANHPPHCKKQQIPNYPTSQIKTPNTAWNKARHTPQQALKKAQSG